LSEDIEKKLKEGMDGGERGGSKNDDWRGLQRNNRERGRIKKKRKRGKGIRRIAGNKKRKMLVKRIRERGWMIINSIEADEEGGWTYMEERGESVIDYILVEEQIREEMGYLEIRGKIESDHHPVIDEEGSGKEKWRRKEKSG